MKLGEMIREMVVEELGALLMTGAKIPLHPVIRLPSEAIRELQLAFGPGWGRVTTDWGSVTFLRDGEHLEDEIVDLDAYYARTEQTISAHLPAQHVTHKANRKTKGKR